MNTRMIGAGIFGIVGIAILLSLGTWQIKRLAWKESLIAQIEARIHNEPVAVPEAPVESRDRYTPVLAHGRFTGESVDVLSSQREAGPGMQVIEVLETDTGRRLLVDRGYVPEAQRDGLMLVSQDVTVTGNLDWPDETDSFTPAPDMGRGLWFARDPAPIAAVLNAEPFLIIASSDSAAVSPLMTMPMNTVSIKNDHLEYAMTWFMLAAVWAVMTFALVWRMRRSTV
ncbi:SURF1 family protein [Pararhodobacter zhoushanensis]|uniref:SURF1 family protein n=1 Tax=Pararhodobacter zhoushanensis TaxID=2479545 RepID=UPI000F8F14FE|nr:SURF1 family protein [Pararhodobacter zhoushanensis]